MTEAARRWETAEAAELAASLGVTDPETAMRHHARALLADHGDHAVPVRLSSFFSWAGVRKVRNEETALEGALRRLPDGRFDIIVRGDRAPTRQRFSIAHELGHVIFYRFAPAAKARQAEIGRIAPPEEERLCNVAAEELLMPLATVERTLEGAAGAERIVHLARECEVSLEASIVRLAPLWRARGELQLWEYRGEWKQSLVRRLGRSRLSLATFAVDEWDGRKVPDAVRTAWRGTTNLYSATKRAYASARTVVVPINRRVPTLLVSHELVKETRPQRTTIENAARDRVRRAEATRPRRDCPTCGGRGWVYAEGDAYDPFARLKPVPMCPCRFAASA